MAESSSTTLARILSGETLPSPPPRPHDEVELDRFYHSVIDYLRRLTGLFTADNVASDPALRFDDINGHIKTPSGNYALVTAAKFRFRLREITHRTSAGGCTINIYKNRWGAIVGTKLNGSGDNTPSTSSGTYTFDLDSANDFAVGDMMILLVQFPIACSDLIFTVKRERMLTE